MSGNIIDGDFACKPEVVSPELEAAIKAKMEQAKAIKLRPALTQTCMLKTKHGKSVECKFWIHTDQYFQYYEPGYKVEDIGGGQYIIKGDTVVVPNHEIMYCIIRNAESFIPEKMFLALGGEKKMIITNNQLVK